MAERRFSLENDFMNYKTDDIVYGFMRCISTAKPTANGKWEEYLTIATFQKNRKVLQGICNTTSKTITNRVRKLIERGLIKEGTVKHNDNEILCYYFPYDYNGKFKLINQDMVRYLVNTRNV